MIDKKVIINFIQDKISKDLISAKISAKKSKQLANHSEMKQEGKHDTRKTEANYLAQALKVREFQLDADLTAINTLKLNENIESIEVGHLVRCLVMDTKKIFYISPTSFGDQIHIGGKIINIISLQSPLAQEMISLTIGDDFEITINSKTTEYEILEIE